MGRSAIQKRVRKEHGTRRVKEADLEAIDHIRVEAARAAQAYVSAPKWAHIRRYRALQRFFELYEEMRSHAF